MIRAVAVVVPARDEQDRIDGCLRSVERAVAALPATIAAVGCVVADRCTDATVRAARAAAPSVEIRTRSASGGVGAGRALGVAAVLDRLAGFEPEEVWLMNTDADTRVPEDWILTHLRYERAGAVAVVGLADLDDWSGLTAGARRRYRDIVAAGCDPTGHQHVYGANLGVRADAYGAVGGFDETIHGEDRDLRDRLLRGGHRVAAALDSVVTTSARRHGRARGGLADLLRALPAHDHERIRAAFRG